MIKLLYKEKNISSFQKIKKFAKENNIKKIGHTGTLDPMATGLLLVATDEDTKLINYLDKSTKTYITTMKFHLDSNTLDIEGKITEINYTKKIELSEIEEKINSFIGCYMQTPPIFSAKKINGKRAYDLARENKNIVLSKSKVCIEKIKIIEFNYEKQELTFETTVSRGTYIRSLIRDIANKLNTSAIMTSLERTKLSNLTLDDLHLEQIDPLSIIDNNLPKFVLNDMQLKTLVKGLNFEIEEDDKQEIVLIFNNKIVGFGRIYKQKMFSNKLFGNIINKVLKME
ncbi:tRNA pseudouridine(55) synthase TruB [Mycoplasma sp. 5370]